MVVPFSQMLSICGLSQSEAADFLRVSMHTVKSWCADRRPVPPVVIGEMADLYDQMQIAADEAVELIAEQTGTHGEDVELEFSYSGEHGQWPSVRCAMTVQAMVELMWCAERDNREPK